MGLSAMATLPTTGQQTPPAAPGGLAGLSPAVLAEAFRDFNQAAGVLQHSYASLQAEVARLRRELRGKNRDLARREQENRRLAALAEVSAVLAHEIRNPLASLELYAGLLAEAVPAGEPAQWLAQMQAGLRLLAATVNNVLQWNQGAGAPPLAPVPLRSFLAATVEFLRPLAARQGLAIKLDGEPPEAELAADRHGLQQVLFNLALNAFRAMARRGRGALRIAAAAEGQWRIRLTVGDEGPGFAAADLPRLFTPGFSTAGGSGLGLAVCRKIIHQHGGDIAAENGPAGAIVTLRLWRWPVPDEMDFRGAQRGGLPYGPQELGGAA